MTTKWYLLVGIASGITIGTFCGCAIYILFG
jgi:hypothetical protein